MNELYTLFTYFIIYAFFGWILESTYKSILQKKLVNSGFLAGPFCPIYGFGALIMYLSLKDVTNNIFILFLFGVIVLSIFEYIVGLFLEIVFKTKYWDYSKNKFNIHGRVCLKNSLYWGILGIIFMKLIHPTVLKLVGKIPEWILFIEVCIIAAYLLTDTITTIIKLIRINIRLKSWEDITEEIKNKIETINAKTSQKFENINRLRRQYEFRTLRKSIKNSRRIEEFLGALKQSQEEERLKLEKRIKRLRSAFPTMNSERLSKFLDNYKKD